MTTPTLRLAYGGGPPDALGAGLGPDPTLRLGLARMGGGVSSDKLGLGPTVHLGAQQGSEVQIARAGLAGDGPTVYLGHCPGAQGDNVLMGERGVDQLRGDLPALLVSYAYLDKFLELRERYAYRDWSLDSGAFTAHASGKPVDHEAFLETAARLLTEDPTLAEVFALDVIGDWKASLKNCETAWERGLPLIPTYHYGEPEDYLKSIAMDYPKIAFGGVARTKKQIKLEWVGQCFARVWPARVHGFGFGSRDAVLGFPFHSTDATNWEIGPCKFGRWESYGGKLSVRGSAHNLRTEVEHYLKLEREARHRWRKEMAILESLPAPTVRLGLSGYGRESRESALAINKEVKK